MKLSTYLVPCYNVILFLVDSLINSSVFYLAIFNTTIRSNIDFILQYLFQNKTSPNAYHTGEICGKDAKNTIVARTKSGNLAFSLGLFPKFLKTMMLLCRSKKHAQIPKQKVYPNKIDAR
jgi:hypothetical protein